MGVRDAISRLFGRFFRKNAYPVYSTCALCGKRVYLPFRCDYCGQYYCDRHRMPFDHACKNIDAWKHSRAGPGKR